MALSPSLRLLRVEQALTQVASEDESIRDAAIRVLISQGDASLLPRLEAIRASASRSIRQAIKPLMDLLKNRAKLASPESDVRRSAATDLGSSGNPSAIAWLDAAKVNESNKWVRYTMEESAALLRLASNDPSIKVAAAEKLGELRSGNAVPALKALVEAGAVAEATEQPRPALQGRLRISTAEFTELLGRRDFDRWIVRREPEQRCRLFHRIAHALVSSSFTFSGIQQCHRRGITG